MKLTATKYIAKIAGTDEKFKFARVFIGEKYGTTCEAVIEAPGLYDSGDEFFIVSAKDGKLVKVTIDPSLASKMARRIEAGETIDWRRESLPILIEQCEYNIRRVVNRPGGKSLAANYQDRLAMYQSEIAQY